jgi:hypothetical protein
MHFAALAAADRNFRTGIPLNPDFPGPIISFSLAATRQIRQNASQF